MVDYDTRSWSGQLGNLHGSVAPNLVGRVAVAGVIGVVASGLGIDVPGVVHGMVGAALGLLLVFRTNASYDRYWEGRRNLGVLVNRSRDLTRQVTSYVEGPVDADLVRWTGLTYALVRQHLRKERDLAALGERITPEEAARLEPVTTRPHASMQWISARLALHAREGRLTEQRILAMEPNLTAMADALGGCERILRTPIPFAYAQHIKAFLVLFCYSAPFALVGTMGWFTPLASVVLAYALFGIDEIGVEIEDPFGYDPNDLPLDRIGDTIDRDLKDALSGASR